MSIHVVALGNVTRDPESVDAGSSSVTKFGIASNRYISKDKQAVTFLDVEVWAEQGGEFAQRNFKRGSFVEVAGELEQQNWETDGQKRSKLICRANKVGFGPLPPKKKEETENEEGGEEEAPAPKSTVKKTTAPVKTVAKSTVKKPAPKVLETEEETFEDNLSELEGLDE